MSTSFLIRSSIEEIPTMPGSIDTSLVRIHTKAGGVAGAGFLVSERHILTCAHVIAQALGLADDAPDPPSSTVSLDFPQLALHTQFTAKVIFWDPVQDDGRGDIAGLELLDKPPVGAEAVHFAPAEQVWDHSFRALGFPSGYDDGVWATGRLLGRLGTNWIQIEDVKIPGFAVISGFSGAPVWDTQLEGVIGMVVASSLQATAKAAFVIPSDVLRAVWPQLAFLMRPPVPRNPYKGLHPFTEHDTRDFFGRDTFIDTLATAVETALTREYKDGQQSRMLTVVLGPSGSGKSSVVMAGLLPCLHDGRVLNSKEWVYLDPVFPGTHPLETLAVSLAKQLPARGPVSLHEELASASARNLHLLVCQLVASPQQKVVLLVDQFEEAFTLTTNEAERRHFFELLVTAVTEPRGPLFVILTLRADFYDRPMRYPELYRLIDDHHVSVLPLEVDDLRKVIEQPANLPEVQLTFESGLVDELLFDMQGQSGALPLLEFTLDQLFQQRNGHQLTLQAYHEMGGVKGALSRHAEETYQALPSDAHRQAARDIFLRLIEPGTTEQDTTRRRADRSEFERADPIQAQQMRETLEAFISARLLTTNQVAGKTTVEVSHEALIREWKRLAEWLREARGDILFQQSLSENVAEWEQRKRPRDRLYRGAQLKEGQAWARRNQPSGQEMAFLLASATQRILWLVGVIVVVLLLIPSIGFVGWYVFLQPSKTLVTRLQDDVEGSLRWCINNASSGSTIRFAQGLSGTIELTGGSLVFPSGKQLTIAGPGANQLTISSSNRDAKIHVSKGATVTISGLSFKHSETITEAFLFNEGTLTVTNSVISDNKTRAGATSFGGGIYNQGTLSVIKSMISNNSSIGDQTGAGGGITNQGMLTVTSSTFSHNSASSSGSNAFGGGIFYSGLKGSSAIIRFCTIYGNTSSVGGGGIWVDLKGNSHITISSSIVAANSAPDGPDISGVLISDGYNLIEHVAGVTGLNTSTDRQVVLADLKIDPTLSTNGGPTKTLALLPGSTAIDAVPQQACSITVTDPSGNPVPITTDQRGDPRPDGSEHACDIGAYESSY
jgi:type II secretory pathway predicted ATPase ExeA